MTADVLLVVPQDNHHVWGVRCNHVELGTRITLFRFSLLEFHNFCACDVAYERMWICMSF